MNEVKLFYVEGEDGWHVRDWALYGPHIEVVEDHAGGTPLFLGLHMEGGVIFRIERHRDWDWLVYVKYD